MAEEKKEKGKGGKSKRLIWIILIGLVVVMAGFAVAIIFSGEEINEEENIEIPSDPNINNSILSDSHAAARLKAEVRDKSADYFMDVADSIQSYMDAGRFTEGDYRHLFDMMNGAYVFVLSPGEYSGRYDKYSEISRKQLISEQASMQLKELVLPAWKEYTEQYKSGAHTPADMVNTPLK